jgi:LysM repeat protein
MARYLLSLHDNNRRKMMIEYHVQKGDTIARVTSRLNTNWETLRKNNPQSIGKARNGNWFLKEGATITTENSFGKSLEKAQDTTTPSPTSQQPVHISQQQAKLMHSISTGHEQAPQPAQDANSGNTITHTIKAGDNLWDLAVNKYHIQIKDIMKDNGITDPKRLQIGQKLTIHLPQSAEETPVIAHQEAPAAHGRTCLRISRGTTFVNVSSATCRN